MNCTYYRPTSHNLREWENIRDKMRYDLSLLEKEPVNEVSLRCYLESLLPQAEPLEGAPGMRFFALGDPNSMPADCRVEYVYWPTYIAAAFCMKALLLCPAVISMIGEDMAPINGDDALHILSECLRGCTGRGFSGHGFDDIRGLVDTMDFFTEHGVQDFIAQYPDLCPEFTDCFRKAARFLAESVEREGVKGSFGDDHSVRAKRILERLGLNDWKEVC